MKKLTFLFLSLAFLGYGQKAPAFQNEVKAIQKKYESLWDSSKETIVFIYEGDNDIASKKKTKDIIDTTREIIQKIRERNNTTQVVIIAAKPSIARWNLKRKYIRLNRAFEKLCEEDSALKFANVWDVMMDGKQVKQDIFIGDGLHMNNKGYDLWFSVIKPYMN